MKTVLFCFYNSENSSDSKYPLAVLRLASYIAKSNEIDVEIKPIDLDNKELSLDFAIQDVNNKKVDMVGLPAYIWTWDIAREISKAIKRTNNVSLVVGGPEVINRTYDDWVGDEFFVYGEGESFLKEFCYKKREGFTNKQLQELEQIADAVKNMGRYVVRDNPQLVYDTSYFDDEFLNNLGIKIPTEFAYYETTRGCPYNCGYCGHRTRTRIASFDMGFIEEEIKHIGKHGIKRLFIIDPILGGTPQRGKAILQLLQEHSPNTRIIAYLRPEYLDDEYVDILDNCNIEEIRIGIQTMNKDVPQWIRYNDIRKILSYLPKLSRRGVGWRAELITGLPGDTVDGLKESISTVINLLKPSYLYAYHLTVLKETRLYDLVDMSREDWLTVEKKSSRALACFSYTAEELRQMDLYANLITSLYNSFVCEEGNKTHNHASSYEHLDAIVNSHMPYLKGITNMSYSECASYWEKQYDHNGRSKDVIDS